MTDDIQKLLKLQECDTKKLDTEMRLKHIPVEVKRCQEKIKAQEDQLEEARQTYKGMEVRRAEMKTERQSREDQIGKYKTQQLAVKKNEEYQALTHEIETLEAKISEAEEEEISLLLEIDEEKIRLDTVEAEINKEINMLKGQIDKLNEQEAGLKAEVDSIISAVEKAAADVDAKYLKAYQNVKTRVKRPPFVLPIVEKKVMGLTVSNEVESRARKGEDLVVNDTTGHIVYMP